VEGGEIILPDGSKDCTVLWGNVPGTYTITVQEITETGCEGPIETYDVELIVPDIIFENTYNICYNQTAFLYASPIGGTWSGDYVNGNVFIGYEPGLYPVTYSTFMYGCNYEEDTQVIVEPLYQAPSITYSSLDLDLCSDFTNQVYTAVDDRSSVYTWSVDGTIMPTSNSLSLEFENITSTYLIEVHGTDNKGCSSDTASIRVLANACQRLYVPNTFTPNGDGINDVFRLSGVGIYEPRLVIYNRWGYPVFETTDLRNVWNGDDGTGHYSENDAYNWKVYYRDNGGFKREIEGIVILIR
jgi:gliding motility-associated-like protein